MTYRLIDELQKKVFPIAQSCWGFGVSRSGYYKAKRCAEKLAKCTASVDVWVAFAAIGQSYGRRRLVAALANRGMQIGSLQGGQPNAPAAQAGMDEQISSHDR